MSDPKEGEKTNLPRIYIANLRLASTRQDHLEDLGEGSFTNLPSLPTVTYRKYIHARGLESRASPRSRVTQIVGWLSVK